MKKKTACIVISCFAVMLIACQNLPDITSGIKDVQKKFFGKKGRTYQKIDPDTLPPISRLALVAFELEKEGRLTSLPFAKLDPNSKKMFNKTDYTKFDTRSIGITNFQQNKDGTYSQNMLTESVDSIGRIDVSENHIRFSLRNPDEKETAEIAALIGKGLKGFRSKNRKAKAELKKAVAEYQRAKGLTPDGVAGRKTVTAIARQIPILNIQEMTSTVLYPQKPVAELYVVPFETVDKNVKKFNRGYESLETVKKHAITPDAFRTLEQPNQRFVLFVYFFDRVNPEQPVRLALDQNKMRWSDEYITPIRYAGRGVWPVMIETMCIDKSFGSERLYANLFMKYTCIGSFRIN
jgi:hypothetical protein